MFGEYTTGWIIIEKGRSITIGYPSENRRYIPVENEKVIEMLVIFESDDEWIDSTLEIIFTVGSSIYDF